MSGLYRSVEGNYFVRSLHKVRHAESEVSVHHFRGRGHSEAALKAKGRMGIFAPSRLSKGTVRLHTKHPLYRIKNTPNIYLEPIHMKSIFKIRRLLTVNSIFGNL